MKSGINLVWRCSMKKVNILFYIIFVFGVLPFSYLPGNNISVQEILGTVGICGELINIVDSSSISIIVKENSSIEKLIKEGYLKSDKNFTELEEPVVIVVRFAFIEYIINPMAKMCIREAAISFIRFFLADFSKIYFYPLKVNFEEELPVLESIVWVESEGKRVYLNSVLVNKNFAVKRIDEENKKFDFIFQLPENDNSDYNSLQGTVTF